MYNILTLNAIAKCGLHILDEEKFNISDNLENPEGIILRSFNMHEMELPENLVAVARAGAGTNNIPIADCSEKGIVVFNTPGANANGVKELVIAALLLSSRKVYEGIEWAKTLKGQEGIDKLVEKGKKNFVGPELKGKKLGVIGLGAIGALVANTAVSLGMQVCGYDPYISVEAAWSLKSQVVKANSIEKMVSECDYITIHVPLNDTTKNMFDKYMFSIAKKGLRLLNFSRGGIVNNEDLKQAMKDGIVAKYVTDFIAEDILGEENIIIIPHLGASTPESEENCAVMAAEELKDYLLYGNITNSVNFPKISMPFEGKSRVAIAHKNIPNMVSSVSAVFAKHHINIANMTNKSRGEVAYTLIDVDEIGESKDFIDEIKAIDGVLLARIVQFVK